ncbi:hypothetical protein JWS13_42235 [Rhodococcus pseudokoreensis]|uniref:Uncharacterized protein n=1 Tax=Rhodococcus pseudokoreensis TaxID=2811421 RepID=A0A974ZY61_9NOCA|nr:hypothetical protein [Rhodococcus pseudokoreensis]QSE94764.1 hypothetical protein JWS13_42235 [Rhodococcus pseudokoreensis]
MGSDNLTITPQALADGAADAPLLSEGAAVDVPILTVDLDGDVDAVTCARAGERAWASDRLLVGLRRGRGEPSPALWDLLSALDTTIAAQSSPAERFSVAAHDPEAAIGDLHAAVRQNVHSSLVLGQVLKLSEHLPVPAAIDVESLAYSCPAGSTSIHRRSRTR